MKRILLLFMVFLLVLITLNAKSLCPSQFVNGVDEKYIDVAPPLTGSCNDIIFQALERAAAEGGSPVTIRLKMGRYVFDRNESYLKKYFISNTTSETEDSDPTKHIALLLKGLKNVTIDGGGSLLLMDGEMTSFVVDSCHNIVMKNFSIDFIYPTQTEMTVVEQSHHHILARVHNTSQYKIENGCLKWYGKGWSFSSGIAQTYNREKDITWRSWCPFDGLLNTIEVQPGLLWLNYDSKPTVQPGDVFQMRDAIRDEVCGLIQYSKDIRLENIRFNYAGNFGIVSQYTEGLTYDHLYFEPEEGSGRTNVGFADFLQISGCKGKVVIQDCRFTGSHDDPINVHGTHLQVLEYLSDNKVMLGFMHHQTYGLKAFFPDDEIAFINANTLLPVVKTKVKKVTGIDDRHIVIETNSKLPSSLRNIEQVSVENITWTPEVVIRRNFFSRVPTRGVLVTTPRKVLIEDNTFYRMQMSAVLIADDARSWYESGPVNDVTIRRNRFVECGEPVIHIIPENKVHEGAVHHNISVTGNHFLLKNNVILRARSTEGIEISDNLIGIPNIELKDSTIILEYCGKININDNTFYQRDSNL